MADNLSACVEVATGKNNRGYGQSRIHIGKGSYLVLAHRIAFEQMFGVSAEGKVVMHTCDNPGCVNPFHLQLGSQGDNMQDKFAKNRHGWQNRPWTHCLNGHEFTDENVIVRSNGSKRCRKCKAEYQRRYRARKADEALRHVSSV